MGSSSSKPVQTVKRPPVTGYTTKYFNGLLNRTIDPNTQEWVYMSATPDYQFRISCLFDYNSNVQPGPDVMVTQQDDGLMCVYILEPMKKVSFATGAAEAYECKYEALPLSEEFFSQHPDFDENEYMRRLNPPRAEDF